MQIQIQIFQSKLRMKADRHLAHNYYLKLKRAAKIKDFLENRVHIKD